MRILHTMLISEPVEQSLLLNVSKLAFSDQFIKIYTQYTCAHKHSPLQKYPEISCLIMQFLQRHFGTYLWWLLS